jgi:histone deacetylase 1/2
MDKVMDTFQPSVIVLQCGCDSLADDLIGGFNLTLTGHGNAVRHILNKGKPTMLLGGGGYKIENVARCWCYETSVALNKDLPD